MGSATTRAAQHPPDSDYRPNSTEAATNSETRTKRGLLSYPTSIPSTLHRSARVHGWRRRMSRNDEIQIPNV